MALLLERYMNNNLGPGSYLGPSALQPGTNPLTAFSAYQPPMGLEQNPFLAAAQAAQAVQALQAAHLHSQMQASLLSAPSDVVHRPPLAAGPHYNSHSPQTSAGGSDRSLDADTDDERREPTTAGVAGLKIPVTCNEVRGMVYLDQQVVACYCPACEARVIAGHDRPLFSFTRFERHCGSKAKKWRLSLRIEPGSIKECPPGDGPMPLGQWMEMKGLVSWGARSTVKIGGMRESDDDDPGPDGNYLRRAAVGPLADRRAAGALAVLAGATSALPAREREAPGNSISQPPANGNSRPILPQKREREEYDTPDLPDQADRAAWLLEQRRRFDAEATQQHHRNPGSNGDANGGAAGGEGGSASSGGAGLSSGGGNQAGKHGAIFKLVYGLLEGADRRAFNEDYLPWLNELPPQRLDQEFNTLWQYLQLLGDMPWQAIQGLMRAYLKAILSRVQAK